MNVMKVVIATGSSGHVTQCRAATEVPERAGVFCGTVTPLQYRL